MPVFCASAGWDEAAGSNRQTPIPNKTVKRAATKRMRLNLPMYLSIFQNDNRFPVRNSYFRYLYLQQAHVKAMSQNVYLCVDLYHIDIYY